MRIVEAYVIDTKALIDFLCIDKQYALLYLKVKAQVPRGVNILASATAKDLRELARFVSMKKAFILHQSKNTAGHYSKQAKMD